MGPALDGYWYTFNSMQTPHSGSSKTAVRQTVFLMVFCCVVWVAVNEPPALHVHPIPQRFRVWQLTRLSRLFPSHPGALHCCNHNRRRAFQRVLTDHKSCTVNDTWSTYLWERPRLSATTTDKEDLRITDGRQGGVEHAVWDAPATHMVER